MESGENPPAPTSGLQRAVAEAAVAPTCTDREVINGVEISDVQRTGHAGGGNAVHTSDDMIPVAQPVHSFSLDLPGDQVAMATTLPLAGEKTMQTSAGSTSTSTMATHGSPSSASMLTASATTASPTKVYDTNSESLIVPKVGMAFKSEEEAYEFYNNYAGAGNKVKANTLVEEGPQQFTGCFEASTRTNIGMPQFTNNMFHGDGLQQFTGPFGPNTRTNTGMPRFANNMFPLGGPRQFTSSFEASTSFGTAIPHFTDSSTMFGPFMQGGYTDLLLQNDQALEQLQASRRLDFDVNPEGWKE